MFSVDLILGHMILIPKFSSRSEPDLLSDYVRLDRGYRVCRVWLNFDPLIVSNHFPIILFHSLHVIRWYMPNYNLAQPLKWGKQETFKH